MRGLDPRICRWRERGNVPFPSPLWGGTSERSEDRVGFCARDYPTPVPSPQGGGELSASRGGPDPRIPCGRRCTNEFVSPEKYPCYNF